MLTAQDEDSVTLHLKKNVDGRDGICGGDTRRDVLGEEIAEDGLDDAWTSCRCEEMRCERLTMEDTLQDCVYISSDAKVTEAWKVVL